MTPDQETRTLHPEDIPATRTDVLLDLPHAELEAYIREARATMDNAQLLHDRLRAVRLEKIRREAAKEGSHG